MSDKGLQIYENIARLCYERGRTVNEVCDRANVSHGMLSDLRYGRRSGIGRVTIERLMKELQCTEKDILYGTGQGKEMPEAPKPDRVTPAVDRTLAELRTVMIERKEIHRLIKAALKASDKQVHSTAVLLETILEAREGITVDGEEEG